MEALRTRSANEADFAFIEESLTLREASASHEIAKKR